MICMTIKVDSHSRFRAGKPATSRGNVACGREVTFLQVFTLVLWVTCLVVGLLGLWLEGGFRWPSRCRQRSLRRCRPKLIDVDLTPAPVLLASDRWRRRQRMNRCRRMPRHPRCRLCPKWRRQARRSRLHVPSRGRCESCQRGQGGSCARCAGAGDCRTSGIGQGNDQRTAGHRSIPTRQGTPSSRASSASSFPWRPDGRVKRRPYHQALSMSRVK